MKVSDVTPGHSCISSILRIKKKFLPLMSKIASDN